ncbi:MAG: UbiX family flavin prenyltransferase [Planctomycetia bacterium]|nr:UbiX family flavin prenyltransferase [Planctomycetia bacterium]
MKILVGITGASGSVYAAALLRRLAADGHDLFAVSSHAGEAVLKHECGLSPTDFPQVRWFDTDDLFAPVASGSFPLDAMVVVPCSMNTLGCLAHGISANLLQRAAAVTLKENRRLILVPRETPLTLVDVDNMRTLLLAKAQILPAMPAFYHAPQTLDDLVAFMTGKILHSLGLSQHCFPEWNGVSRNERIRTSGT